MPPKQISGLVKKSARKRCRNAISLKTKLDVLRRFEAGEKLVEIAKALGLATSTIGTIKENRDKIIKQSKLTAALSAPKLTRQRSAIMEEMEKLLGIWIEDNNQRNMPMSEHIIQEKARSLFEYLRAEGVDEASKEISFSASRGWFDRFRKRQNLHNVKMRGEAASADTEAANRYPDILKTIIERGGYLPEQVFNVDETGLYWKRMPERTFISKDSKTASGHKVHKERLTLLLGGNASGDYKLKPLLIYSSENPRALKGCNKLRLPVIWRSNRKAWMTMSMFEDWFKNNFYPDVKKYLQQKNLSSKILLLLDNAPGHPNYLAEMFEDVQVEFLPKNTTSILQPMDQGLISTFKSLYLRRTFQQLVNGTDEKSSIKEFWAKYNIKHAIENIEKSWNEVKLSTMNHVWKNVWPECVKYDESDLDSLHSIRQNIVSLAGQLGFEEVQEIDVIELVETDQQGFTNEDLVELNDDLQTTSISTEREMEVTSRRLKSQDLRAALSHFESGIKILQDYDENEDRCLKSVRGINESIECYKQLYKTIKAEARQATLDSFFISSTSKSTARETILISSSSCSSTCSSPLYSPISSSNSP